MRELSITTGTLVRFILLLLGVVFLFAIRDVLAIILISIVIASAVDPIVRWLYRYKIPRVISVITIYLVSIVGFLVVIGFLIQPLLSDVNSFAQDLPGVARSALLSIEERFPVVSFGGVTEMVEGAFGNFDSVVSSGLDRLSNTASSVFSGVFSLGFILVISFYLAVQDDGVGNALRIITPKEYEDYVVGLWIRTQRKIGRWLQGQLVLGLIVGILVFIALWFLGVKHALILALLAAIFELIPYFGPILASIPAIAAATLQSPFLGVIVLVVFVVVQQLENHLIYPLVVRKTVGVPPLLAIIALLIGGKLGGFMGFIIAVPLAVVLVEFLNDVADRKRQLP